MGFTINLKKTLSLSAGILSLVLAAGCAKPMTSPDVVELPGKDEGGSGCCVKAPGDTAPTMDPVDGTITEGLYQGQKVLNIDPVEKMLTLKVPMPGLALMPGFLAEAPIPGLPGGWVEMVPTVDGTAGLELHLPLEFIIDYIDDRDSTRLPNGDPLPAVPGGELPAFAVAIHPSPDVEVLVYVGPESVAVLYWSPFDVYLKMTLPIYVEDQPHPIGWFHAIPHKRNEKFQVTHPRGGFMVGVSLPAELRRQLDDLF